MRQREYVGGYVERETGVEVRSATPADCKRSVWLVTLADGTQAWCCTEAVTNLYPTDELPTAGSARRKHRRLLRDRSAAC